MWAWSVVRLLAFNAQKFTGSRDRHNSIVQTAAMGQIPRSTERILVSKSYYRIKFTCQLIRLIYILCKQIYYKNIRD